MNIYQADKKRKHITKNGPIYGSKMNLMLNFFQCILYETILNRNKNCHNFKIFRQKKNWSTLSIFPKKLTNRKMKYISLD